MAFETPLVSVIVLNWNGEKCLEVCLSSLKKQTYSNFEVIVVDNASSDGAVDFIKTQFPEVKIIENNKNLGFAGGNNIGIRVSRGEYIMMLNNDTEVNSNCVEELTKVMNSDNQIGACATKILSYYNREIIDAAGLIIYPDGSARGRGRLEKAENNYNSQEEIFFGNDCAVLYKKKMLDEIGLYDEDFFAHHDGTDLGLRAHWRGWRCMYVPTAIVYHRYSASFGAYSPLKAFLVERNRAYVAIKNFPLPMLLLSLFFTFKRLALQAYSVFTKKGAGGKFTETSPKFVLVLILLKAYLQVLLNLPKFLRKRRKILNNKKISNREFYALFKKYPINAKELVFKE